MSEVPVQVLSCDAMTTGRHCSSTARCQRPLALPRAWNLDYVTRKETTMRSVLTIRISCALLTLGVTSAWAQPPPGQKLPEKQPVGRLLVPPPLWGFADLHTHPATHVSFGADSNGQNGIMWGKPGMDANAS